MKKTLSIVIPVYNEEKNIPLLYDALRDVWQELERYDYEFLFVDDGSGDRSAETVEKIAADDARVKFIGLSRNFGKEMATTAGLHAATGDAVMMLDADLQHPPKLIPEFVKRWEEGSEVVVGVRSGVEASVVKRYGSYFFYKMMRAISDETDFEPGETDFRLLDRAVVDAYKEFGEHQRMTRSLINWLGFKRARVSFQAPARQHGTAAYSTLKLVHLAFSTFIANSLAPMRFTGYLGVGIAGLSGALGLIVIVEKYVLHDPFSWGVAATAQLAILNAFLVGVVLAALGIVGLYVGSIHREVTNKPLYVIRKRKNF